MALKNHIALREFADGETLARTLAQDVAAQLRGAIAKRGKASLALSGGNTPKRFLQVLSHAALDWPKVTVTLVDERWVGEASPRSNAALVKANLLQNAAAHARFLPLHRNSAEPETALAEVSRDLEALLPLDVVVLGMGDDGHTASFFPGADRLAQALNPVATAIVLPLRAEAAGEPRISLTLPPLLAARWRALHIEGAGKRKVFDAVLDGAPIDGQPAPVAHVIGHAPVPLPVYWSP